MRGVVAAVLLVSLVGLSGCSSSEGKDGGMTGSDSQGYRDGVVIHNEPFSASTATAATFTINVEEGARQMVLEIMQDSGVLPNLHVELSGCGSVDPPASAGWQPYPLCDGPAAGVQTLTISVKAGSPAGTGRALLRADLPS